MQKIISEFPNYSITDEGIVINNKTNKPLKSSPKGNGYLRVCLWYEGKRYYRTIHRLVAEAFIDNPLSLPEIDHINTDRADNRVENLRWCTTKENMNNPLTKEHCRVAQCKPIACYTLDNQLVTTYPSTKEAAADLGVTPPSIFNVLSGKRKTCKGYIWRYLS